MKTYKTDWECEPLFNRFVMLSRRSQSLFQNIQNAATIVQNPETTVTDDDLKNFFKQVSELQNKLEMMMSELDDLYGDVGVYIDEKEIL